MQSFCSSPSNVLTPVSHPAAMETATKTKATCPHIALAGTLRLQVCVH